MAASVKKLTTFHYRYGGLELSDHRRVVIPPVLVPGGDGDEAPYKVTMGELHDGIRSDKGCDIWQFGDNLFILWAIMHRQNAAFFCKLKPAPQSSLAVYLDATAAIKASQFARRPQDVRDKVSGVDKVTGSLIHISTYLMNRWFESDDGAKAETVDWVLDLRSGGVKIAARKNINRKDR